MNIQSEVLALKKKMPNISYNHRDKVEKNSIKMHIAIGECFHGKVMFHADDPEEDEDIVF